MNESKERIPHEKGIILKPFPSNLSLKKKELDFTVFRDLKILL